MCAGGGAPTGREFAADEVVDGDITSSVVLAKTRPFVERPRNPFAAGVQPWAWAGNSVLAFLDGETLTRFDLSRGVRSEVKDFVASDFVPSPGGEHVIAVGVPGRTQELWLLDASDTPSLSGDWTPNHPIPPLRTPTICGFASPLGWTWSGIRPRPRSIRVLIQVV